MFLDKALSAPSNLILLFHFGENLWNKKVDQPEQYYDWQDNCGAILYSLVAEPTLPIPVPDIFCHI